ncbi:pentatricopeptide repeat-containing protein At3g29230-like [Solanum dulcamara]|uniref:pentatricopeptide repeat-containing protein At3g29230-like n=1 Tax=Solanum dulcamara TaxID=45834 RepID=UPI002485C682|nr:pentatricopeptide repeat-containing protein At3g29230-like [Solanum dulcamara]XP_055821133.1 pentatricopeptide repeat-containing protein At3g29230-like [Solanum dulcamara]XP_055821134.1 pentatricopeptide repeat-containing protein At3g29230-like [Solanum dulcamara]
MAVRFKNSKQFLSPSSEYVTKFIKTQINLSKPTPKLWSDYDDAESFDPYNNGVHNRLTLSHPILRILDSCTLKLTQFNQVHAQLIVSGIFQHPLAAGRVMMKLCSSQSIFPHAVKIFENLENPDAFICNTIMKCYVNFDDPEKALVFYSDEMVKNGIFQNHYTFPILVKACADLGRVKEGEMIHAHVVKCGFELDLYTRNVLIHMYSVCCRIHDARKVFDLSSDSDLVTWNTMIDGYVKNGEVNLARYVFDVMPERDVISWNSMLSGYVGIGDMEAANLLFREMPSRDTVSWNCLLDGYARTGNVVAARAFFEQMDYRNVVSWTTLMALYVRLKYYTECLGLFDLMMQGRDVQPNEAILMSVLTACGHLGRLDRGKWIHSYIRYSGSINSDMLLSTALLTMYAKCSEIDLAKEVFAGMPEKSVVTWNSMIMGYGIHGHGEEALETFLEMEKSGVRPNDATFICVLSACTHSGMVLEGWWYFNVMTRVYRIEPKVEHYGCMIDLLGRTGLMRDFEDLIKNMPMDSGPALWGALLSACKTHSNMELGEIIAKRLIERDPEDIGSYVLLSNIYAAQERWDDVEKVRKMIVVNGIRKEAGSSLVQFVNSDMWCFPENVSVHKRVMMCSMLSEMGAQIKSQSDR